MSEHVDVLIVGAGLSGIGAAYRLTERAPQRSYAILEGRERIGGTWDLFRYPGVRSDSDMYTLAFGFEPWTNEKAIADGADIRDYLESTAVKHRIADKIRYGRKVTTADWDSATAKWTVTSDLADGTTETFTANFLYLCSGYYNYDQGHAPQFAGAENYAGQIVHPQFWPEDLDYADKNVVIIGSGATAITLLPSMAKDAANVTMLQRTPTYVLSQPGRDLAANAARKFLPNKLVHQVARMRYAVMTVGFYQFCRAFPKLSRKVLLGLTSRSMPRIDRASITPPYKPWDQRLCVVPGGDLYDAVQSGKADIVTDRIAQFTAAGIELESGQTLPADIVVTATGLELVAMGNINISVDGTKVEPHSLYVYKGQMFSGVPNLAWCVGYTNASWTLRADLTWKYVADYLNHLDLHGYAYGTPDPNADFGDDTRLLDLASGYIARADELLPKSGARTPWKVRQNWFLDSWDAKRTDLDEDMIWTKTADLPAKVTG